MASRESPSISTLAAAAYPIDGTTDQYRPLLKAIGDAQVVMIGEESHGTHEFYHHRAEITKRLITEKGFNFVAVEADWPDAYKLNRYVHGLGEGSKSLQEAFSGFQRFPRWMWRNDVVLRFVEWMREYNGHQSAAGGRKAGFYGLDLYSLFASADAVLQYLKKNDPEAFERARKRYGCFDRFGDDTQQYAYHTSFGLSKSCEQEVRRQLLEMLDKTPKEYLGDEESWCAEMNARVVKDAEEYYRKMFTEDTWNIRDQHMSNTLDDIMKHYAQKQSEPVKAVVWAHNSHLGDASQTEFGRRRGELNVGQLTRERYGLQKTFNIGFSTNTGTVTAADEWDEPPKIMKVNVGMKGSYEEIMHNTCSELGHDFALIFRANPSSDASSLKVITDVGAPKRTLERAIGVIYKPKTERQSHYFEADLAKQFDAYIHIDNSSALRPLDKDEGEWHRDMPETYPFTV